MNKQNLIKDLKPPVNIIVLPPCPVPESLLEWYAAVQKVLKERPNE